MGFWIGARAWSFILCLFQTSSILPAGHLDHVKGHADASACEIFCNCNGHPQVGLPRRAEQYKPVKHGKVENSWKRMRFCQQRLRRNGQSFCERTAGISRPVHWSFSRSDSCFDSSRASVGIEVLHVGGLCPIYTQHVTSDFSFAASAGPALLLQCNAGHSTSFGRQSLMLFSPHGVWLLCSHPIPHPSAEHLLPCADLHLEGGGVTRICA